MVLSCHIVPFLTHCHFDFLLRRGSTTMWAGKMELWPWPWTMEEGETMFVSGRIYINLGTCEIWGHLFALLKNLKHQQHKSPAGCWQCFTKQLLTWSLESDLMKFICCNFAYMRRQWLFAESFFLLNHNSIWTSNRSTALVPLLYYKGIAKNICQLQCKDIRPRTFGFWRHYPRILNTPFGISHWTGS